MPPFKIIPQPSPNFNERPNGRSPDLLVMHYTGMQTGAEALTRLCDPRVEVSAHYLVETDGRIYQLVDEDKRAWHAGVSHWQGEDNINDRSIGIEIVNKGHEFGYEDFPEMQMVAVEALASDIITRHNICPTRVVGHSDIAPSRKQDPGEKFDWSRLANQGVGIWPHVSGADMVVNEDITRFSALKEQFIAVGYNITASDSNDAAIKAVVTAFQRHWRQSAVTGKLDNGTIVVLNDIVAQFAALKNNRV